MWGRLGEVALLHRVEVVSSVASRLVCSRLGLGQGLRAAKAKAKARGGTGIYWVYLTGRCRVDA